jgi:hypothetical protein
MILAELEKIYQDDKKAHPAGSGISSYSVDGG